MFIQYKVSEDQIKYAHEIRAERDAKYPQGFAIQYNSDMRWCGDLGEIVFDDWLKKNGITNYKWILDEPINNCDFIVNGQRVGIKTVKRQVPPQMNYGAQITARHIKEPVDYFFFLTYEHQVKRMWLLGGITKDDFKAKAEYKGPGSRIHKDYIIRPGHEIYQLEGLNKLTPPKDWLTKIA